MQIQLLLPSFYRRMSSAGMAVLGDWSLMEDLRIRGLSLLLLENIALNEFKSLPTTQRQMEW